MAEVILIRQTRFEVHECLTCGSLYAVQEAVINQQRKHGGYHHCQNGHSQGWSKTESEDEKIRRERDRLQQKLAQKDDELAEQRRTIDEERRKAAAARGQVTKLHNRAKAGLCSCCNRHFTNLERHMASKHKEGATVQ
jgi:hypothetical protein